MAKGKPGKQLSRFEFVKATKFFYFFGISFSIWIIGLVFRNSNSSIGLICDITATVIMLIYYFYIRTKYRKKSVFNKNAGMKIK